jgi:hypothetical protein
LIKGIDGSNLIGDYIDTSRKWHRFLYDGTTWTTLDNLPGSPTGISGNNIVGCYYYDTHDYSYLYDGTSWVTLLPDATNTRIEGIDGSNIVGNYYGDAGAVHSFLYNLDTQIWTLLSFPGAKYTEVYDIDGSNIVGSYEDRYGTHGFIATIPEPVTILLFGIGGLILRRKR